MELLIKALSDLWPIWFALAGVFIISWPTRQYTGLYGKLYENPIGLIGLYICLFWIFAAIFAGIVTDFDPEAQSVALRKKGPGAVSRDGIIAILGGDVAGRDIFGRLFYGARVVIPISVTATALAFVVGIVAGLPAGYFGRKTDAILSFLANAILAFPVILLFILIVLIARDGPLIPTLLGVLGFAPVAFVVVAAFGLYGKAGRTGLLLATLLLPVAIVLAWILGSWFSLLGWLVMAAWAAFFISRVMNCGDRKLAVLTVILVPVLGFIYSRVAFSLPDLGLIAPVVAGLFGEVGSQKFNEIEGMVNNLFIPRDAALNVFIAVCFASAPGIFRLVRGLTLDTKERDYVAAAQTRGENTWYIMIFEILPNVRGPLIVDAALRIGYTIILLGTLGFFGLGLEPTSPDWGTMINIGRGGARSYPHMVIPPALALMSLVLGINMLADGLREMSLKD